MTALNFKIGVVDNDAYRIRLIQRKLAKEFEVIEIPLIEGVENMVESIISSAFDGIIVDYKLNDTMPEIAYNGLDIFSKITEIRMNFPTIILTSFEEEVLAHNLRDPFHVLSKKTLDDPELLSSFSRRFKMRINSHQSNLDNAKTRLNALVSLSRERLLSIEEQTELQEVDELLEKSLFGVSKLPKSYKLDAVSRQLDEIVKMVDEAVRNTKKRKRKS